MFRATIANAYNLLLAFIHVFWMWYPKLAFSAKETPCNFLLRELLTTTFPTFIALSSLLLNNKWHILVLCSVLLFLNLFQKGLAISSKTRMRFQHFCFLYKVFCHLRISQNKFSLVLQTYRTWKCWRKVGQTLEAHHAPLLLRNCKKFPFFSVLSICQIIS